MTQFLLGLATTRGEHEALVRTRPAARISYRDLASTVTRAAAGLAWRGLRPRDVVGVSVPDVLTYVLACNAIRAAGGTPCPVSQELSVPEAAGQLADCGARILITAGPLSAQALAAADRSWVRQVISFDSAPGTTPFSSLLDMGTMQPLRPRGRDLGLLPYGRGADGSLRPAGLTHDDVLARQAELSAAGGLSAADVVLAVPPVGDTQGYSAIVHYALRRGATLVAAEAGTLAAAAAEHAATAAVVPAGTAAVVPAGAPAGADPLRLLEVR